MRSAGGAVKIGDVGLLGAYLWYASGDFFHDDIALSPSEDREHYAVLSVQLEKGKSYQLTLKHIQVSGGDTAGASAALCRGDEIVDQTVFSIEYGNQFDFLWGFQVPEDNPNEGEYQLRLFAGVSGGTENIGLSYQGICLKECSF